jgi:hypothetical protein
MRNALRQPLTWILLMAAGLRLAGLFWGLPGSDGWDDDGFAPRNFLTALALTWKPGAFFTYPPLHAILLAAPSLPVMAWALAHASSLHPADVIATITQPKYMTYFAVVARLVSIVMSLGIIWAIGEMAKLVAGRRAGLFAAGACALGVGLTYYGQVSNLDVPSLFWAVLALWQAMRAVAQYAPRRFWWAALCTAAAIATKDQAYALFALSVPLWLGLWFAADAWPRRKAGRIIVTLLAAAAVAVFALLLVDGAITNWSGFVARLHFLTGPASHDYAEYARGPLGWWGILRDAARYFACGAGVATLALMALGLWRVGRGKYSAAAWLPLLAILSFTICFNLTALRTDDRFLLPQGVLAAFYIGIAADWLLSLGPRALAWAIRAALATIALLALHGAMGVTAAMVWDPRYEAARWLSFQARPGDGIEVYDRNWLLPHLPPSAHAWRVGLGDLKMRSPMPGITELRQPFAAIAVRRPRFVVISRVWARRWLEMPRDLPPGRIYSPLERRDFADAPSHAFFIALTDGRLGYRLVHVARPANGFWPRLHIHDSLNEAIGIYERRP